MTSNHEEAQAILLVYLELEFLIQLLMDAQQWSQFPQVVWLSLPLEHSVQCCFSYRC